MDKIMILGCGVYQMPLIEYAVRHYYVILVAPKIPDEIRIIVSKYYLIARICRWEAQFITIVFIVIIYRLNSSLFSSFYWTSPTLKRSGIRKPKKKHDFLGNFTAPSSRRFVILFSGCFYWYWYLCRDVFYSGDGYRPLFPDFPIH